MHESSRDRFKVAFRVVVVLDQLVVVVVAAAAAADDVAMVDVVVDRSVAATTVAFHQEALFLQSAFTLFGLLKSKRKRLLP